ncbi:MAG: hypothetical protein VKP63_03970 [Cyanobacteriota bacterium]|nr:hypothetical protein [Cyanobacteriota bacterium]
MPELGASVTGTGWRSAVPAGLAGMEGEVVMTIGAPLMPSRRHRPGRVF